MAVALYEIFWPGAQRRCVTAQFELFVEVDLFLCLQDRKQILKVLKPHIEKICLDDEAQTVLFTALDVIE